MQSKTICYLAALLLLNFCAYVFAEDLPPTITLNPILNDRDEPLSQDFNTPTEIVQGEKVYWGFELHTSSCSGAANHIWECRPAGSQQWLQQTPYIFKQFGLCTPSQVIQQGSIFEFRVSITDCAGNTTISDIYYISIKATLSMTPCFLNAEVILSIDRDNPSLIDKYDSITWGLLNVENACGSLTEHSLEYRPLGSQVWIQQELWNYFPWGECFPWEVIREDGIFEFRVSATDCAGYTTTSETYYLDLLVPPHACQGSYQVETNFLRSIVDRHATGSRSGFADMPGLWGADWGDMTYSNGQLYIINGDVLGDRMKSKAGVIARTDVLNPERMSFGHYHNWLHGTGPAFIDEDNNGFPDPRGFRVTGTALGQPDGLDMFPNAAFVTELPDGGQRIWLIAETTSSKCEGSCSDGIGLFYTDDEFTTWKRSLQLVELDFILDRPFSHGTAAAGYVLGDYAYIFIAKRAGLWNDCILRCRHDLVNNENLSDWHILEGFDEDGNPMWSPEGANADAIQRGGAGEPGLVDKTGLRADEWDASPCTPDHAWNPYLNKWTNGLAVSDSLFGPYEHENDLFLVKLEEVVPGLDYNDNPGYGLFVNDVMMIKNGEIVYSIQSKDKSSNGTNPQYHSNFILKHLLTPKTSLALSQKCARAGDTVAIEATNEYYPASELSMTVTVDGEPATFLSRNGNTFKFQYTVTGKENGGLPGRVNVEASATSMARPWPALKRSVALIVNHNNYLAVKALFPDYATIPQDGFKDTVRLQVNPGYPESSGDEVIEEGGPPIGITAVELWFDANKDSEWLYHRIVKPPYEFAINTRELVNGTHKVTVKAYDTLDRRAEEEVFILVNNAVNLNDQNLIADGSMEHEGLADWTVWGDPIVVKVGNGQQRDGGAQAMKISSSADGMDWGGIEKSIDGFSGGEQLNLTMWLKGSSGYYQSLPGKTRVWVLTKDEKYVILEYSEVNLNHYKKHSWAFTNPPGNSSLTIRVGIVDTPDDGNHLDTALLNELWIDDMELKKASASTVKNAPSMAICRQDGYNELLWQGAFKDNNIQYTEIRRRVRGETGWPLIPLARLDRYDFGFYEGQFVDYDTNQSIIYEYQITHVDSMGIPYSLINIFDYDGDCSAYISRLSCKSDVNNDGTVNVFDLVELKKAFFTNCNPAEPAIECKGDFNLDGKINTSDLAIIKFEYGRTDCK